MIEHPGVSTSALAALGSLARGIRRRATFVTFFTIVATFAVACSHGDPDVFGTYDGGGASEGGGDAGLDTAVAHDDGGFNVDAPETSVGGGGCSADLQDVIDSSGHVVQHCAPAGGCYGGACIDACEAAAKSKGTIGCDFLVPTPSIGYANSPCFAAFVANAWPKPVHVTIDRGGTTFDATKVGLVAGKSADPKTWSAVSSSGVPQDQVGVFFLSSAPDAHMAFPLRQPDGSTKEFDMPLTCPITPAVNAGTMIGDADPSKSLGKTSEGGGGRAFHLHTDVPVSAYDIAPFGGASSFTPSAELLLPTSAWGTNYVTAMVPFGPAGTGFQFLQVVAAQDGTKVQLFANEHVAASSDGVVKDTPQHGLATYTMSAGEYLQIENVADDSPVPSIGNLEGMNGSILSSDKPIGVFVGHTDQVFKTATSLGWPDAPSDVGGAADSAHQQLPPVSAMASEYAVAPYPTRRKDGAEESIGYRILGVVDGTTLKFDPPLPGAPTTLAFGAHVDFEASGAFVVRSQDEDHPFFIGQQMSGAYVTSHSRPGYTPGAPWLSVLDPTGADLDMCLGDPDFVVVFPPAQYLQKYVFFTDPTYGLTTLSVTRVKGASGFEDVSIDCVGTLSGWRALGTDGRFEWTTVDLWRSGASVGGCTNGRHVATSKGTFGVVVWGLDYYASYGYPAGGNVATLNSVVVSPIR